MSIFSIILILTSAITLILMVYALKFKSVDGAISFSLLMLSATIFSLGYAFEFIETSISGKFNCVLLEYIGISFIPLLYLIFSLQFAKNRIGFNRRFILSLLVIPISILIIIFTNHHHHLFYRTISLNSLGSISVMVLERGPLFWVNIIYANISILIATLIFLNLLRRSKSDLRIQALIMSLSALPPWIANVIYISGFSPKGIDLSAFGFALTGVIIGIGFYRYHLFDLMPIALENVFNSMRDGVILIDKDECIVNLNPVAKNILNNICPDLNGKHFKQEISKYQFLNNIDKEIIKAHVFKQNIDNDFWFKVEISPITNKKDEKIGYLINLHDITSQLIAEQKLIESNKTLEKATQEAIEMASKAEIANNAKSVFLANISHEIRTPLNAIIGFAQLVNRDPNLSETQKEYNLSILRAGEHLLTLINDILELSKVEAGRIVLNPKNIDLLALLDDVEMIFKEKARSKHLKLLFQNDKDLPKTIIVDESKLRQIFINLIGNALKFTDEGYVSVRTSILKGENNVMMLNVDIQDTGPGIADIELQNLFRYFVQTTSGIKKGSGTGLGLALSNELAKLMGGEIIVSSQVCVGSVFTVRVKVEAGHSDEVERKDEKRVIGIEKGYPTPRILVVDDKEENLKVIVGFLKQVGFETYEATNGLDAIEKFNSLRPNLTLMDLHMPEMDGYEAIRRIKQISNRKDSPIIAITADILEDSSKISSLGIQGYIHKPFRENELFNTIGIVLGIKYTFEDNTKQNIGETNNDTIKDDNCIKLPNNIVTGMLDAISIADLDQLIKLIKTLETENSDLANQLLTHAKNYDYEYLQIMLKGKEQ